MKELLLAVINGRGGAVMAMTEIARAMSSKELSLGVKTIEDAIFCKKLGKAMEEAIKSILKED